jgi:hypothetical protein
MSKIALITVPVFLLVVALAMAVVGVVSLVHSLRDTGNYISAPGSTTVTIDHPGSYVLWNETAGVVNGQFKTFPDNLPNGATILAKRKPDGTKIPMVASMNTTMDMNGTHRRSIGEFTFDKPGQYELDVTGFTDQRSFYLDRTKLGRGMLNFFLAELGAALFVIAAIISGIFIAIRLSNGKKSSN